MVIQSEKFNRLIGFRRTFGEILKTKICCTECEEKIKNQIQNIEDYLNDGAEMGVVLP